MLRCFCLTQLRPFRIKFFFWKESVIDYIESLLAKIPESEHPAAPAAGADEAKEGDSATGDASDEFTPPQYDTSSGKEDFDAVADAKQQAADAKAAGNWEQALEYYNKAVVAAPPSALLYANRAIALEKLGHYRAAEKDCNLALESNPDSAKALKVRGKLRYKHLEDWHGALSDLNQAQTIDFDPDVADMLKELTKLRVEEEKKDAQKRIEEEEKLKKRAEEIKKAKEEAEQEARSAAAAGAAGGGMPGGMGGMPGGMGGMPGGMGGMPGMPAGMGGIAEMLQNDPELQEAMKNPKVIAAFSELMSGPGGPMGLMSNPGKLQSLMSDPEVGPVLQKIMSKMMGGGGMGGMPGMGGMGGMPDMGGGSKGDEDIPDLGDLPDLD